MSDHRAPHKAGTRPGILLGVTRIARGRADGLAAFGNTPEAFLASLAPLIAFPLVGGGLMLADGGGLSAISDLLATFCALLAPPVLSWRLARHWHREALWPRFATAFNWCQWALPAIFVLLLLVAGVLITAGMPNGIAGNGLVVGLIAYGLWLHWFLARRALELSAGRAVVFVAGVNLATAALVMAPGLIMGLVNGPAG